MAGGFADADPSSLLNAFTAWDKNKYDQAVDVGERRRVFLDDQAIRLQNTTSQLQMFYNDEAPKIAEELSAKLGNQWAALGEPERKNAVDEEFMNRNYDMLKPVVDDTLTTNPHAIKAFGEVVGGHRAFKQMRRVTGKDGTVRYVVDVENANTGTTGPLDDTEDGVDTSKNKDVGIVGMSGAGMLNNIFMLGETAALSRGQGTVSSETRAKSLRDAAANQGVEANRAAGLAAVPALSKGETGLLNSGSSTMVMTDMADGSGGGGLATGASSNAGPAAPAVTTPVAAPTNTAPVAKGKSGNPPAGKTTPVETTSVGDVVVGIATFAPGRELVKAGARAAGEFVGGKKTEQIKKFTTDYAPVAVKQLNAAYKPGVKLGLTDSAMVDRVTNYLKTYDLSTASLKKLGLHADLVAEIDSRLKRPTVVVPNTGAVVAGERAADSATSEIDAAAKAAGMSRGEYLLTPPGKDAWTRLNKNFKESDVAAIDRALVNLTADSNKLNGLTGAQSHAFAVMRRLGVPGYTEEDIIKLQQGRVGGPSATDALALSAAGSVPKANTGDINVDSTIAQTRANNRAREREAVISAASRGDGAAPKDEWVKNVDEAIKLHLPDSEFSLGQRQELANVLAGSIDLQKRLGINAGTSSTQAAQIVNVASEMIRAFNQKNKPGLISGLFNDAPKIGSIRNQLLLVGTPRYVQDAYLAAEAAAVARNPSATQEEIMEAFVATQAGGR